jgi:hypothetical protein
LESDTQILTHAVFNADTCILIKGTIWAADMTDVIDNLRIIILWEFGNTSALIISRKLDS